MSRNRISSRQVDSGPLARPQRRAGDGIWWDGAGAYGIHSWKSTERQARGCRYRGGDRGASWGPPLLGVPVPIGLGHSPSAGSPPIEAVMVFTRISMAGKHQGASVPVGSG